VHAAAITCLWYGVFGSRPVQVILIRDASATGYDLALVTTDLNAGRTSPTQGISSRMAGSAALGRVAVRVASSVSAYVRSWWNWRIGRGCGRA
jgi:hypothetical protein